MTVTKLVYYYDIKGFSNFKLFISDKFERCQALTRSSYLKHMLENIPRASEFSKLWHF